MAPNRSTRQFTPQNSLARNYSAVLQREQSENYGDEVWEDEEFVEAANESFNHESAFQTELMAKTSHRPLPLVDNAKENDPVITAETIKGREELRNKTVFNKNGKPLVPLSRLRELCLLLVDSMSSNRMYYSYRSAQIIQISLF